MADGVDNFALCLCLRRISLSLGSSLLLAFVLALVLVLASLIKTGLNLRKACYISTGVVKGADF